MSDVDTVSMTKLPTLRDYLMLHTVTATCAKCSRMAWLGLAALIATATGLTAYRSNNGSAFGDVGCEWLDQHKAPYKVAFCKEL